MATGNKFRKRKPLPFNLLVFSCSKLIWWVKRSKELKFINLAKGHTVGRHFHYPPSHWVAKLSPGRMGGIYCSLPRSQWAGSGGEGGIGDRISFQASRDLWHLGHCRCHPAGWVCDSGAKRHLILVPPVCHVLPATCGMKVCPPPRLKIEPCRWLSIHAGRYRSALGRGCSGDVTPQSALGSPRPHPTARAGFPEQQSEAETTGRAILFEVSPQSCQFRSSGQKSFYLLNRVLCRTKRQAGFKAGRCAKPQAPLTLLTPQQPPARQLLSKPTHGRHGALPTRSLSFENLSPALFLLLITERQAVQSHDLWLQRPPARHAYRGAPSGGAGVIKEKH